MEGQGLIKYPDGTQYSGQFLNDQRHGKGIVTNVDGSTKNARFNRDKIIP
jgi:hypothetical protein